MGVGRLAGPRGGSEGGSEGGLEFFEAGSEDSAAMQIFEIPLATEGVDPLAHGVGNLAEPGVEDVENRLAGILEDAFFETFDEALLDPFLDPFLEAFFEGEFFEEGDVGHGFVGEALLELVSELNLKPVGQGHQPVDQAVQLSDFRWGVSLVEESDGEFEAEVFELLGVVAVLLGAEVGSDDEADLLVAVAWVVEFALEVDGFADAEAEGDAAAEVLVAVRCGAPFPAGVSEDGQGEGADAVFVEDAVVVGEQALGQVGIVVHLDLDVDVEPLVGAIEEADFEELVDPLGPDFRGRGDFVEFLLEGYRLE